jgi:hypothetical protein
MWGNTVISKMIGNKRNMKTFTPNNNKLLTITKKIWVLMIKKLMWIFFSQRKRDLYMKLLNYKIESKD